MRYLRLWRRFVVAAVARESEFRVSFLLAIGEGVAQMVLVVLTVALVYQFAASVAGWSRDEVLVLVGIYRIVDGLIACQLAPNMLAIPGYVRDGELDFHLLRPVSSQFLVSTRRLAPVEAINVAIGAGLVVYAGSRAGVAWSPLTVAEAVVFCLCGLVLLYALWFAIMTCSFWLVRLDNLETLFYGLLETARYPVSFFSGLVRTLLTLAFPVAFATTFPAEALLGRAPVGMLPVGLALAALALLASHLFWRRALHRYESASS